LCQLGGIKFQTFSDEIGYLTRDLKVEELLWSSLTREQSCGQVTSQTLRTVDHRDDPYPVQEKIKTFCLNCLNHRGVHKIRMYFMILRQSIIAVHLMNFECPCLKCYQICLKRFVVFLRSRLSYSLLIVCKMTVWLRLSFFVKSFCRYDQRCDLGDQKRDSSEISLTFCKIFLSIVLSWSEQRGQS
jgi:hypothetical protein